MWASQTSPHVISTAHLCSSAATAEWEGGLYGPQSSAAIRTTFSDNPLQGFPCVVTPEMLKGIRKIVQVYKNLIGGLYRDTGLELLP